MLERERQAWAEERGRLMAEASLKTEELASLSSLASAAGDSSGMMDRGSGGESAALRGELRRLRNALLGVSASDERIYYDCAQTLHLVTVSSPKAHPLVTVSCPMMSVPPQPKRRLDVPTRVKMI